VIAVNEPRKHHYIPVFYQKHFTNAKGLLWVYDRCLHTYKELPPRSVCFEKDFYALKPENAPWDRRIESLVLSYVDGVGSWAIRELLSGQRNNQMIQTVAYFIGVQFNRLPSVRRAVSEIWNNIGMEMLRGMTASVGRMQSILERYTRETGKSVAVSAESMVEAVRGGQVEAVATERPFLHGIFAHAVTVSDAIDRLDWQILMAPRVTGFIICDSPVVVVPPRGVKDVGFLVPGTVISFPLNYSHCLRLGEAGQSFSHRKVSKETVRIINYNIAANSERFVMGPEKAQLVSVIKSSGSAEEDLTPRFTTESVEESDGHLLKITFRPRRYFYGKGSQAP
jgi:hypothetical protein